jgi:tetratricopeptide (TPR) repeat protein
MSSKRPAILMGILLVLIAGYLAKPHYLRLTRPAHFAPQPPLPGKDSISGLKVVRDAEGKWTAEFDYFFTGGVNYATILVEVEPKPAASSWEGISYSTNVVRGQHRGTVVIGYPGAEGVTRQVIASMRGPSTSAPPLASQTIEQVIDWPTYQTWLREREAQGRSPEESYKHAVALIDSASANSLDEAKFILERLVSDDPKFAAGYIELARVAMKSNWSSEGLHQAETLLASASDIEPDNANAKILLGHVYTHQRKYAKAEAVLADAARSDTRNLWLWTNWGQLLEIQGKIDLALVKYREAITRPMNHNSHDRARIFAYMYTLAILEKRQDFDRMEPLYKQQIAEFGSGSCYSAGYSRFLLQTRGDIDGSIDLSKRALNQNCEDSESRQLLGLAHYVKWASESGPDRNASLHQARIYLPAGPMPLYLLASHTRTVPAAKALIASGEKIDQHDSEKMTALSYALREGDLPAAQRLLALGARADVSVGFEEMPLALVPVMEGNVKAVRMLKKAGVNYSKLRFHGVTALQFARQMGYEEMAAVLGPEETAL